MPPVGKLTGGIRKELQDSEGRTAGDILIRVWKFARCRDAAARIPKKGKGMGGKEGHRYGRKSMLNGSIGVFDIHIVGDMSKHSMKNKSHIYYRKFCAVNIIENDRHSD